MGSRTCGGRTPKADRSGTVAPAFQETPVSNWSSISTRTRASAKVSAALRSNSSRNLEPGSNRSNSQRSSVMFAGDSLWEKNWPSISVKGVGVGARRWSGFKSHGCTALRSNGNRLFDSWRSGLQVVRLTPRPARHHGVNTLTAEDHQEFAAIPDWQPPAGFGVITP